MVGFGHRRVTNGGYGSGSSSFAATARRNAREVSMLDGVMLLWFVLTAAALLFVAIDIRTTPESPVLKWGFVLLTAYTGVIGAFLYVLGCREPLPGLHER
jgi:glucan phosphoethanolaminetransferase (alkaline phosphatase superfamily)